MINGLILVRGKTISSMFERNRALGGGLKSLHVWTAGHEGFWSLDNCLV